MKTTYLVAAMVALSACVPAAEPIVSDFNGDSVKIVQNNGLGEGARSEKTDAEAGRICAKRGRRAEYASVQQLPTYQAEFLYLCL